METVPGGHTNLHRGQAHQPEDHSSMITARPPNNPPPNHKPGNVAPVEAHQDDELQQGALGPGPGRHHHQGAEQDHHDDKLSYPHYHVLLGNGGRHHQKIHKKTQILQRTPQRKRKAQIQTNLETKTPKLSQPQSLIRRNWPEQPTTKISGQRSFTETFKKSTPKENLSKCWNEITLKKSTPKENLSKCWNEFTNLDGKLILTKTYDIGLVKTTRRPKNNLITNMFPFPPKNQNPSRKKKTPITQEEPTLTPRRSYLLKKKLAVEETGLQSTTLPCTSTRRPGQQLAKNKEHMEACKKCIPDHNLQRKEKDKYIISPVNNASSLIRHFEEILSKKEPNDVSIARFECFGREEYGPMRCSNTTKPRLDSSETKLLKKMHLSDWGRTSNIGQSSESGEGLFGGD